MKYLIHCLGSSTQFEDLVILICGEILGTGVQKFSTGRDSGRDSKFTGTAISFPSSVSPWTGKFIIQAKFTENPIASCSDSSFFTQLKNEELKRIKNLITKGELENYLLFTNRALSADKHAQLQEWLCEETKIKNIEILGKEKIDLWLQEFPQIARIVGLDIFIEPLRFYEKDIKDIILIFSKDREEIKKIAAENIFQDQFIGKQEKNKKNNLSQEYFQYIVNSSLSYFQEIDKFLKDPKNSVLLEYYKSTVNELQNIILIKRKEFDKFERLFLRFFNYVLDNNKDSLGSKRNLILVFLHYMYWNCDIGLK